MAKAKGDIFVDIEKCKGCELCIVACTQDSLVLSDKINKKGYHYVVKIKDNCTGCVNCALVCPEAILKVYRKVDGKKEQVATVTNVKKDMTVEVS